MRNAKREIANGNLRNRLRTAKSAVIGRPRSARFADYLTLTTALILTHFASGFHKLPFALSHFSFCRLPTPWHYMCTATEECANKLCISAFEQRRRPGRNKSWNPRTWLRNEFTSVTLDIDMFRCYFIGVDFVTVGIFWFVATGFWLTVIGFWVTGHFGPKTFRT